MGWRAFYRNAVREISESGPVTQRERLRRIIFEADTPGGKAFDVALIAAILGSVLVVMLESVESIREASGTALQVCEWVFT